MVQLAEQQVVVELAVHQVAVESVMVESVEVTVEANEATEVV